MHFLNMCMAIIWVENIYCAMLEMIGRAGVIPVSDELTWQPLIIRIAGELSPVGHFF